MVGVVRLRTLLTILSEAFVRRVYQWQEQVFDEKGVIDGQLIQVSLFLDCFSLVQVPVGTKKPEYLSLVALSNNLKACISES